MQTPSTKSYHCICKPLLAKTLKKITMNKKKTIYHLVVDKSGSMSDCIAGTIEGFNEQLASIRKLGEEFPEQEMVIGLTTFNGRVEHKFVCKPASEAYLMNRQNYVPSGSTALLDAIGQSIALIDKEKAVAEQEMPTTVVMIILTDGYENCSKSYTHAEVQQMIERSQETGSWTFSYLGATLDAVDVAERLSIKRNNSISFEKGKIKTEIWDRVSLSMRDYSYKKEMNQDLSDLF
jgi:uncharacterized protein YegL